MPVFTFKDAPAWCKLREYMITNLAADTEQLSDTTAARELYVCTQGELEINTTGRISTLKAGDWREAFAGERVKLRTLSGAQVCHAKGHWTSITGAGLFNMRNVATVPKDHGSPYSYAKSTGFDRHYHDLDEYWIVLTGRATVCSEEKFHEVAAGDCVATGMGWHHDVVRCLSETPARAVYIECDLERQQRTGHLWEQRHGKAEPCLDRV